MRRAKILILVFVSVGIVAGAIALLGVRSPVTDQATSEQDRMALKSLPYLDWHPVSGADIEKRGVTIHEQDRCYEGLNIYNHDSRPMCYLMDMSGAVLHIWSRPEGNWHDVEPLRSGDLLVAERDGMLLKLDWESGVRWASNKKYHHDVTVADNGDIYALTWDVLQIPDGPATIPIVNDYVTILSPDGTVKQDISIFSLFGGYVTEEVRGEIREHLRSRESAGEKTEVEPQTVFDVFHTNTVDIVETPIAGVARKEDVLICIRNLDMVAVIDVSADTVVWSLDRHDLEKPHQPSFVDGNLLVFDNGAERGYSRVLEIDPVNGGTVWEYTADPESAFFSLTRGGCQRLPNGNTLICESNKARVFEVTPQGEIVWEFHGTEVKKALKRRRPIYRMTRLAPDYLTPHTLRPE
jgi:outer membrane protein assembly factor BamB